jgi:hypothetical protein
MGGSASLDDKLAGSVAFLTMCAVAAAGWQLLRQARAESAPAAKVAVGRFFMAHIVPEAAGLKPAALAGADLLYALDTAQLVP